MQNVTKRRAWKILRNKVKKAGYTDQFGDLQYLQFGTCVVVKPLNAKDSFRLLLSLVSLSVSEVSRNALMQK